MILCCTNMYNGPDTAHQFETVRIEAKYAVNFFFFYLLAVITVILIPFKSFSSCMTKKKSNKNGKKIIYKRNFLNIATRIGWQFGRENDEKTELKTNAKKKIMKINKIRINEPCRLYRTCSKRLDYSNHLTFLFVGFHRNNKILLLPLTINKLL